MLERLGYSIIIGIDNDMDSSILQKYGKVIVLHNKYATQKEFDAITDHPHVIYLYPNSLYAKVSVDHSKNTIRLFVGIIILSQA